MRAKQLSSLRYSTSRPPSPPGGRAGGGAGHRHQEETLNTRPVVPPRTTKKRLLVRRVPPPLSLAPSAPCLGQEGWLPVLSPGRPKPAAKAFPHPRLGSAVKGSHAGAADPPSALAPRSTFQQPRVSIPAPNWEGCGPGSQPGPVTVFAPTLFSHNCVEYFQS